MAESLLAPRPSRINAAAATDTGRVRKGNEDRWYLDADRGIFLVVDGVGGHAAGEVAAAIAVNVIMQRLERPLGTPAQRVREAIALANNEILRQAERSPAHDGMTCVLTLALLTEDVLTIGHVGDSRLYELTPHGIRKLTHDHSPVGEREDAQEISEAEAMRHPRRNEVFRDVGSTFREPDDPEFIELIETTFEADAAILLCSDGLSDMVPSAVINRTVRQHAGNPEKVAAALIEAANKAGGKDNITVVYAEGPQFARAALSDVSGAPEATVEPPSLTATRAGWLGAGLLLGIVAGVLLHAYWPFNLGWLTPNASRTLIVGRTASAQYPTIAAALATARPNDIVQLEPGEYSEVVVLAEGVDLVARVPGTVTLVAPPGFAGWTSITVTGRLGNRISGIRLLGRADAPIAVGLRVSGHDVHVDDLTFEGAIALGVDVLNDGAIGIRASQFADVQGIALKVGPGAQPAIEQNVFLRRGSGEGGPAIDVADTASPEVTSNLFVGYQNPVQWPAGAPQVHRDNFFIRGAVNGR